MTYVLVVVVSFHQYFLTMVDRAYNVRCFYSQQDKTVTTRLDVSMIPTESLEAATMLMPNCQYTIRSGSLHGPVVQYTKVGDTLVHRWECDNPNLGMLVRNCFVNDGYTKSIRIVDATGCPVFSPVILGPLQYDANLNLAYVETMAYKFHDRADLYFQCQIQTCNKLENECIGITPPSCPTSAYPYPDPRPQTFTDDSVTYVHGTFERPYIYPQTEPFRPIEPYRTIAPYRTIEPFRPVDPYRPLVPQRPVEPYRPIEPLRPIDPYRPTPTSVYIPPATRLYAQPYGYSGIYGSQADFVKDENNKSIPEDASIAGPKNDVNNSHQSRVVAQEKVHKRDVTNDIELSNLKMDSEERRNDESRRSERSANRLAPALTKHGPSDHAMVLNVSSETVFVADIDDTINEYDDPSEQRDRINRVCLNQTTVAVMISTFVSLLLTLIALMAAILWKGRYLCSRFSPLPSLGSVKSYMEGRGRIMMNSCFVPVVNDRKQMS
ncbi:unnamed protein product [Soboliphyme baturini]|uniref:ZP domain-containing protein n=1 Tax=Soboliphyme baturini TaxID=241478 RepID=A0A183IPG4_9BILA|nr:unnamed protein product [Soboliphyme baturini]